ncbi:MAG: D-Ala-D-Ala carboxypeptidase family metallohydrolase [Solirubrobacteraceae bacterium]
MENISKHISFLEATTSQTAIRKGINNDPSQLHLENMQLLAKNVFEPLRHKFGAIRISSFFRSKALNTAIGGSKTSQHMTGEAIDIQGLNGVENRHLFEYIKNHLDFDQLIWEFGNQKNPAWVHVSYSGKKNRKQILYLK